MSRRRAALSPSRAKDFMQCPLMFRYKAIDRLPEPPSLAAVKGTLVHAVLEHLYDLPAAERTEHAAQALLEPRWVQLQADRPDVHGMFTGPEHVNAWLDEARALVGRYFTMENPQRLEPASREQLVEVELPSGLLLRGYIDRIDVAPATGAVRVVDYKTGKAPGPRFQSDALFQMRFYALMLYRLHGAVPARLQLVYMGNGRTLTMDPTLTDIEAMEAEVEGLWARIVDAVESGDFPFRTSKLCDWCPFKANCPAWGGTVPPMPVEAAAHLLTAQATPTALPVH